MAKIGEEKSFVAQSLPWGNWIEGQENKLIEHKGNLYLRYYDVKNADISSLWLVNGKIATAEQFAKIINYLQSKKNEIKTQTEKVLTKIIEEHKLNYNNAFTHVKNYITNLYCDMISEK